MTRHNCPNCGAPIESTQCPYCGTVFYDFTVMDSETPTYIRMNWYGHQMVFRALMRSAEINMHSGGMFSPDDIDVDIEFTVLPDDDGVLMKRIELKGE